jgi:hypothetical protein
MAFTLLTTVLFYSLRVILRKSPPATKILPSKDVLSMIPTDFNDQNNAIPFPKEGKIYFAIKK